MSEVNETLEVVARTPTEVEAGLIVDFLGDRGIEARAVGEYTAAFRAEVLGDVSVLVRHRDLQRAKDALAELPQTWTPEDINQAETAAPIADESPAEKTPDDEGSHT